jgi:uncharacterized protein (TIGR03435 family)
LASQSRSILDTDLAGPVGPAAINTSLLHSASYSVVAIHPIKNEDLARRSCSLSYGRNGDLRYNCATARALIAMAWGTFPSRIVGGPSWTESDWYSVEAKADEDVKDLLNHVDKATNKKLQGQLLQKMLTERFHLKTHTEIRTIPVLELVSSKKGARLQSVSAFKDDKDDNGHPSKIGSSHDFGYGQFAVTRSKLSALILYLEMQYQQVIVDKTNLDGYYDFKLAWSPEAEAGKAPASFAADPGRPPLSIALEEQLGLKLVSAKAPVEVLVIDSMDRPTEN